MNMVVAGLSVMCSSYQCQRAPGLQPRPQPHQAIDGDIVANEFSGFGHVQLLIRIFIGSNEFCNAIINGLAQKISLFCVGA